MPSNVGTEGRAQEEDTTRSVLGGTRATQGDVGVPATLSAHARGDTEGDLLAVDDDGFTGFLGAGETGVDETKGDAVAADAELAPNLRKGVRLALCLL